MQEHQRQQSQVFRLAGQKLAKRAPQPNRLRAKVATNQVFASRGRVAFIEDQVDDRLHRLQPLMQQIRRGNFIRNVRVANLLLRANQALRQRRLGRQKRPCDFRSCQSAERPQRQRHLRLAIQRGMATGENQAQPIVRISGRHLFRREVFFACIPFNFILERVLLFGLRVPPPRKINKPPVRHRRNPRAGLFGNAPLGPVGQRRGKRLLHRFFGQIERSRNSNERSNNPPALFAKHVLGDGSGIDSKVRSVEGARSTGYNLRALP
jgi:hypothetical protein